MYDVWDFLKKPENSVSWQEFLNSKTDDPCVSSSVFKVYLRVKQCRKAKKLKQDNLRPGHSRHDELQDNTTHNRVPASFQKWYIILKMCKRERERENINADLTITKEFRVEQYGIKNQ